MNSLIKVLEKNKKINAYIEDIKKGVSPVMLSGITDAGKSHLAYATSFYCNKPICIITYNEMQAKKLLKDLKYFTDKVFYFPKREIMAYDYIIESMEILNQRIEVLNKIYEKDVEVIITTIEAVMQKTIQKSVLYKNILKFEVEKEKSLDIVKETLIKLGYERYELIEGKGQFSVRGGILDIAVSSNIGVRIEFWGEQIDSIRYFNILNQRSTEMLEEITIYPANEFILEKEIEQICKHMSKEKFIPKEDIEEIRQGNYINKIDKYFNHFYEKQDTLIDYLENEYVLFIDEVSKVKKRSENIIIDNENIIKNLKEKNKIVPESLLNINNYEEFLKTIEKKQTIYLEKQDIGFVDKQSMHAKRNGYSFSYREVNFFRSGVDLFFEEIKEAKQKEKIIILLSENNESSKKLKEILKAQEISSKILENEDENIVPGDVVISTGTIPVGFEAYDFNIIVIETSELFKTVKPKKELNSAYKNAETVVFSDLKINDYVVHKKHGIGQFVGINTIRADGVTKDYIKIKYKDDDILYVPTNSLDTVRKYIATGDSLPKLNRLGSKEWEKTKGKVKSNLREVAKDLIELYAKRENAKGFAFSKDTRLATTI